MKPLRNGLAEALCQTVGMNLTRASQNLHKDFAGRMQRLYRTFTHNHAGLAKSFGRLRVAFLEYYFGKHFSVNDRPSGCSQLASDLENVAELVKHRVGLFCVIISLERAGDAHVASKSLDNGKNGGRARVPRVVRTL